MKFSKFKKPTLGQVVIFSILVFTILGSINLFFSSIQSAISITAVLAIAWGSYKLYKSTPSQRIAWGKKYKILGVFFKEDKNNNNNTFY